jgi:spermidine dehydrogenase
MIIPHLCPEVPEEQAEALAYQVKVPMAYVNVALKTWKAFEKAGISDANCPHSFFSWVTMDFPVSMGEYQYPKSADEPAVIHMAYYPKTMYEGLSARDQFRLGRYRMLDMTFEDYEREIVSQLTEMLAPYGFNAERDISAITVNRWPHGYAYEYMDLWDEDWAEGEAPHEKARKPIGNIYIANSDSEAFAYVDGAINAAHRAVSELSG